MRNIRAIILFVLFILSCSNIQTNSAKHSVSFYWRFGGSNGNKISFIDIIALSNYRNKSVTLKYLYDLATTYVDTVKSNFLVIAVTILGVEPGVTLPPATADNIYDQDKRKIISFTFKGKDTLNRVHLKKF